MTRLICVLAATWMVGCAPYSESRPQTFQGDTFSAGSDPDVVTDAIDLPGLPAVLLVSAKGNTSLAVFQANTGEPYVTFGDTDSDGVFDMLMYFSLSADGEMLALVEDYGMDGQPDFILNFQNSTGSVFYEGSWRKVRDLGWETPSATIDIDGENRLLHEVLTEIGRRPF
ncbi:MAG: hypothetical protein QNJ14_08730 [Woeseiaceae bacterium]|nr:hypothetical protein [Woeseiaceae bacterium]